MAKVNWSLDSLMTSVSEENVNAKDSNGWAPIHYVAGSGGLKLMEGLVSLGADLNLYTTGTGESKPVTPILVAIKNGQVGALNLLFKLGANSELKVDDLAPWMYAIRHKTLAPELTSALIVNGADVSQLKGIIEKYGAAILTRLEVQAELVEKVASAANGGAGEILEEYLAIKDSGPIVDISKAFESCDIESVVSYVKDKRVSDKDKYSANLFAAAAMQGGSEYIKMMVALLQAGYEINRPDSDGYTALQRLVEMGNVVALSMLFTQDANPNEIGPDGFNAVHKAILAGSFNTLNLLMENGGNPNLPAKNGDMPLTMVMKSCDNMSEMFYVLIKHGADVSQFDIESMKLIAGESIDPESVDLMIAVKSADLLVLTGLPDGEGDINQKVYYARLSYLAKKLPENYEHLAKIKQALSEDRGLLGQDEEMDTFIIICKGIKWKEIVSLDSRSLTIELGKFMQALGLEHEVVEEKLEELVEDLSNLTSVENANDLEVGGKLPEDSLDAS